MSREHVVFLVREFLLYVVVAFPLAFIAGVLYGNAPESASKVQSFIGNGYLWVIGTRIGAHVLAFMLDSWELTNNKFMRGYSAYLYRFHWVFRPLYRVFGVPVPYAELASPYKTGRAQEQEDYSTSSHQSHERDESPDERYQRRQQQRRQREQEKKQGHTGQNYHQEPPPHDTGAGDSEFYEKNGKYYRTSDDFEITWFLSDLGLTYPSSYAEAEQAYRDLAKQYHPDKVASAGPKIRAAAEEEMKKINTAWDKCKEYIEELKAQR